MLIPRALTYSLLIIACGYQSICAQTRGESNAPRAAETKKENTVEPNDAAVLVEQLPVTIALVGGGQIIADEVSESNDGFWYKRGTVSTFIDRSKVEQIKRPSTANSQAPVTVITGNGRWKLADADKVKEFFATTFNRPLPLTAFGQSDLHNRWGLDHRNGMDVGLHPDSTEGRALITFLRAEAIPFLAFRGAIPGVATGPHVHIGNPSHRIPVR